MSRLFTLLASVFFGLTGHNVFAGEGSSDLAKGTAQAAVGIAVMDLTISKEFGAACGTMNPFACYIAIGAGMTAASMIGTSRSANKVGGGGCDTSGCGFGGGDWGDFPNDQTGGGGGPGGGGPDGGGGPPGAPDPGQNVLDNVATVFDDINKKTGIKVDTGKGTFTGPDGKERPLGILGSGKALADAGLISPDQVAKYDQEVKKIEANTMRVASVGLAGGGGGGGSAPRVKYEYDDPYASLYGLGDKRKPSAARTAGLTRTLASGEVIGAQTDNIFEMVRRKYQEKSDQKQFVGQTPSN